MKNIEEVVEKLTPLVKSYARDMNLLIAEDQATNIEFYKVVFGKYFNVCDIALNGQEALDMWNKDRTYYDLVVTDVDMPIMNGVELVRNIREESMEQSIIVLTATTDLDDNQNLAFYFIDGLLPKPIDTKKLFILLYRVLKKISEKKDFNHYIEELEDQVNESIEHKNHLNYIIKKLRPISKEEEAHDVIVMVNTLINKTDTIIHDKKEVITQEKKSTVTLSADDEKDLRFSTADHKISSTEFMEQLDDTIVDKVEDFLGIIDRLVEELDKVEKEEPSQALVSLDNISKFFDTFIDIINNLVIFPIVSRAFLNLNKFIHNIKEEDLVDNEKKSLLVSLLFNIEKDVTNWIDNIFIQQTADNIYYFDASFSNGALEIESTFNNYGVISDEVFDDDDLGFF